ncbi:MAG: restriction endonuclease subunit S [Clostridia bacterium]|nr:restriction endonuclease subunit S [Clostridia bacterium]
MKYSGIEWIGDIPAHWNVVRTKTLFRNHKDVVGDEADNYERLALTLNGVIKRSKEDNTGLQPEAFNGYQILREGELVFKLIDLENVSTSRVGLSPYTGIVSPAYIILKPQGDIHAPYAQYYYLSMWQREIFNHIGDDGVRSSLNAKDLLNVPIIVPTIKEQEAIANYLDSVCSTINQSINQTRETITQYKKLKQAIISHTVVSGIRGERGMRPSGIEWIGNIPQDWDILRGKVVLRILERPVEDNDGVITCFRDGEVTLRSNRREEGFTLSLQEAGYQGIEPGDLVVHGMDGFAGAIGISDSRGKGTPVLNVMDSTQNKRYIMYYLRRMAYDGVFLALSTGIRVRSCDTNWNKIKNLPFLIPSIEEQQEIADYLDEKCAEIDRLISMKEEFLVELEKYKKTLVYDYVTGKKEVPTA